MEQSIRMTSWWLAWEDLEWPRPELEEKVCRRADEMAGADVNAVMFFGAHFRWDYLPLWERLHSYQAFVAEELHRRGIRFFDHHSSTLAHRIYDDFDPAEFRQNRHHVQFHPSVEAAAEWRVHGHLLNDWRMIQITTGKPVFLQKYSAEQFCFNHPDFVNEYVLYLKKLLREVPLDGLMCDDSIFFDRFNACGCRYCREKFGRELPPSTDTSFWGNYENEDFRAWVAMRYNSVHEFQQRVRDALPPGFPLLNCCSASTGTVANACAMTYEEFGKTANIVMIEMGGENLASMIAPQLHHLAIAREIQAPCLGLAYGFSPDSAAMIWGFNKFLGSDTWFSTHKNRLRMRDSDLAKMPDQPELIGPYYSFEKRHPELFGGEHRPLVALLFSRVTRDNHGGAAADYSADFVQTCRALFTAGVDFDVVLKVPEPDSGYRYLFVPSVVCMSESERRKLEQFRAAGGMVIASGPLAVRDENNRPALMFAEFTVEYTPRPGEFPQDPYAVMEPLLRVAGEAVWREISPNFHYNPCRAGEGCLLWLPFAGEAPEGWYMRRFRNPDGSENIHFFAKDFDVIIDEELEKLRAPKRGNLAENRIVKNIRRHHPEQPFQFAASGTLYFPPDEGTAEYHGETRLIPEQYKYFILRTRLR